MSHSRQTGTRSQTFGTAAENINHIKCDVTNCAYHTTDNTCDAETVHVKPCTASSCCTSEKDTACETFIEK